MWQVPLLLGCCMYLKDCSLTVVTYSIICCYSNKAFLIIISNPRTLHGGSGALGSPGAIYLLTRNSLGALGSPGAIHYLTAKLSLRNSRRSPTTQRSSLRNDSKSLKAKPYTSLRNGEALSLSGTIHSKGRSPTSLRNGEALSLSGTIFTQGEALPQSQKSYFALYD